MTDAERDRYRKLNAAAAHVELATKNLSASIKQALQSPDDLQQNFRKAGNA